MPMKLYVGDIVQTKKKHPCGADQWEILRVGMDFRMRCTGCGHQVWIPRVKLEKSIKRVLLSGAPAADAAPPAAESGAGAPDSAASRGADPSAPRDSAC